MTNQYAFQPERLELVNPPYPTGNLLVTVPVGNKYINSFTTRSVGDLNSAWEGQKVDLPEEDDIIAMVLDGFEEIERENPLMSKDQFISVSDYEPGYSLIKFMSNQRVFDKYQTPLAPNHDEVTLDQMFDTIRMGYQRLYEQQEQ